MTELHALGFVVWLSALYITCHMNDDNGAIWLLCRFVAMLGLFMVLVVLWPK